MRYWPVPSLTTERTFSMSTGLSASTVTPGRIAPDVSLMTPVITACAYAVDAVNRTNKIPEARLITFNMTPPFVAIPDGSSPETYRGTLKTARPRGPDADMIRAVGERGCIEGRMVYHPRHTLPSIHNNRF